METQTPKVSSLIARHERCLQLLEAIQEFHRRKRSLYDNINGFAGQFPRLRSEYTNRIHTINRCIERLFTIYEKTLA